MASIIQMSVRPLKRYRSGTRFVYVWVERPQVDTSNPDPEWILIGPAAFVAPRIEIAVNDRFTRDASRVASLSNP